MKNKNNLSLLLKKIEGENSLSDKFHQATNNPTVSPGYMKEIPKSWIKVHFKTYPRLDRVKLSYPAALSKLSEIMRQRRSVRQFSGQPISTSDLSHILYSSAGIIAVDKDLNNSRRPYPSAGARYPLEVYPLILNCEKLKRGLYHYNVQEHSLEIILKQDLSDWLKQAMGGEIWALNSCVVFIITGVLDRVRIKYKNRGYRFILLEAGHLAQNLMLLADELGLGSCAIGGYIDDEVNKLLDVQHTKEVTLYLIAVGKV